jgi:hypothetical protein
MCRKEKSLFCVVEQKIAGINIQGRLCCLQIKSLTPKEESQT